MSIGTRVLKWAPFVKSAAAEKDTPSEKAGVAVASGPPLVLLVSDASGRASFQFNSFADAASAGDFVRLWFPTQQEGGVIAFWALADEPAPSRDVNAAAEPVVLIRDAEKDGIVYLFSFVDIESAQSFVQSETESGVDAGSVLVYWAAPVRIDVDDAGSIQLTPDSPPRQASPEDDSDASHTIENALDTPPATGWARVIGRNVQVSPQVESIAVAAVGSAATPVRSPEIAVPTQAAAASEHEINVAEVEQSASPDPSPQAEPILARMESAQPPSWFEDTDGQPPLDGDTWRNDGFHDVEVPDMGKEIEKVLGVKRWEPREGPFQGFQSPPGRF